MGFYDTPNQYRRTLIEIHTFNDGTEQLVRHESDFISPPCSSGAGCRACSYGQEACEFDPKTGLCNGRMP